MFHAMRRLKLTLFTVKHVSLVIGLNVFRPSVNAA